MSGISISISSSHGINPLCLMAPMRDPDRSQYGMLCLREMRSNTRNILVTTSWACRSVVFPLRRMSGQENLSLFRSQEEISVKGFGHISPGNDSFSLQSLLLERSPCLFTTSPRKISCPKAYRWIDCKYTGSKKKLM